MSSQALELGAVVLKSKPSEKKSGTQKNGVTDEQEESNMTELAKDFFLQTHGDKGGSFDLLNSKESLIQNEKQQEKKVPQAQQ